MKNLFALLTIMMISLLLGCSQELVRGGESAVYGQFEEIHDGKLRLAETLSTEELAVWEDGIAQYKGRFFSMKDFDSLTPGSSTLTDLLELTPYYPLEPFGWGEVLRYPAKDGAYIYVVCTNTVQAIYLTDSPNFVGWVRFKDMLEEPSLRPEVGRWV